LGELRLRLLIAIASQGLEHFGGELAALDQPGAGGDDGGGLGGLEIAALIAVGVAVLGGIAYLITRSTRRRGT